ncbi:hypothetical protein BJV74DRAFT_798872 [Russula compacta]|nr:hypothetical protein BJV74DRAFT_798872 [Russula compacta]
MPIAAEFSATLYLALVLAAGRKALTANGRPVPCIQGECPLGPACGLRRIWESEHCPSVLVPANSESLPQALADRSTPTVRTRCCDFGHHPPAAGWQITSCDQTSTELDVQLVRVAWDDNTNCDHINALLCSTLCDKCSRRKSKAPRTIPLSTGTRGLGEQPQAYLACLRTSDEPLQGAKGWRRTMHDARSSAPTGESNEGRELRYQFITKCGSSNAPLSTFHGIGMGSLAML